MNTRRTFTTEGLVLAARPLGEADRLAIILTGPYGKLACRVRAARKSKSKLRAGTEPATFIRCQLVERGSHYTLTQVEVLNPFLALRTDWRRALLALLVLEVVDALCYKAQPNQVILEVVLDALNALESSPVPVQLVQALLLKLLSEWGAEPVLFKCAVCGAELGDEVYFSPFIGGLACKQCASNKGARSFMSLELKRYLQALARGTLDAQASDEVKSATHSILRRYYEHYLERRLKGFQVVLDSNVL